MCNGFRLSSEEALTSLQHVCAYMRQCCSNPRAFCRIIHLQCTLSDSVLAWRCYVIFGKQRWLKWTLMIVVLAVAGTCRIYLWGGANFCIIVIGILSSIIQLLYDWRAYDGQPASTLLHLDNLVGFPTMLTWAVCSLVLNTVLSTSIVAKIV
jgi:hypothetical protein